MTHTATYSPEDNKLRLYPAHRLSAEEYAQMKAAGFSWAPRQELFVAPMWTPNREDLLISFCGEIGDEDKSLVERAEERSERFEEYSEKRADDAKRAGNGVKAIADNIPFGQPILVGHHSEKRARKDAERIENGMRRAVKMWETSSYWSERAAGAIAAAKYKERPDVRARRIKGLESDKRKQERTKAEAEKFLKAWEKTNSRELALQVANYDHISKCFTLEKYPRNPPASQYEGSMGLWSAVDGGVITWEQAREIAMNSKPRVIAWCDRWIQHYDNRLIYERAMLAEAGGTAADKYDIQPGGRVLVQGEWCTVIRVNKVGGVVNSLTTNRRFVSKVGVELVRGYEPPTDEQQAAVKKAVSKAPICNYPGEILVKNHYTGTAEPQTAREITQAEWTRCHTDYKTTRDVVATDTAGAHRVRIMYGGGKYSPVFITDAKRKDPPAPEVQQETVPVIPPPERVVTPRPVYQAAPVNPELQEMKAALKAGVTVVTAPQLFPTPPEIAARMTEYLEVTPGCTVLEPSAGTGNLMEAVLGSFSDVCGYDVSPAGCSKPNTEGLSPKNCASCLTGTARAKKARGEAVSFIAYEINRTLAEQLQSKYQGVATVINEDFLTTGENPDTFDHIIMNPPFENGVDIKHINHAYGMLREGGRLVALCAAGPRQEAAFRDRADHWEVLPAGSFKNQGTGVNVALLVFTK